MLISFNGLLLLALSPRECLVEWCWVWEMVTLEVAARGGVRPGGDFLLGLWFLRSFLLALCWQLALVSMAGEFMMYSVSLMKPQLSSCWLLPLTWGLVCLLSVPAWVPCSLAQSLGSFHPMTTNPWKNSWNRSSLTSTLQPPWTGRPSRLFHLTWEPRMAGEP